MKPVNNKFHEKILSLAVIMFLFVFTASAQTYDDLPPEFGLGDDPAPGAPIDIYIPIVLMITVLFVYLNRNKINLRSKK